MIIEPTSKKLKRQNFATRSAGTTRAIRNAKEEYSVLIYCSALDSTGQSRSPVSDVISEMHRILKKIQHFCTMVT